MLRSSLFREHSRKMEDGRNCFEEGGCGSVSDVYSDAASF